MMTLDEIGALQIGDKIQLPNGVEATVKTVNAPNMLIALDMLGGSTGLGILTPSGEVPPEKANAETVIICAWADLINATKI